MRRYLPHLASEETPESERVWGGLCKLKRDERSVSWLARQIPCTRNHVYKIFRKSSIDCALLLRISKAMQFNFFQYYTQDVGDAVAGRIG